jgi:hypothetical protein
MFLHTPFAQENPGKTNESTGCVRVREVTVSHLELNPFRTGDAPMAPAPDTTEPAFGDDLSFTRQTPRAGAGGTWVIGLVAGHRFQALVFPEDADNPAWEYADGRLAKLWVQRLADRTVVFHFDRGPDVPAQDAAARAVVEFLTAALAERVHG